MQPELGLQAQLVPGQPPRRQLAARAAGQQEARGHQPQLQQAVAAGRGLGDQLEAALAAAVSVHPHTPVRAGHAHQQPRPAPLPHRVHRHEPRLPVHLGLGLGQPPRLLGAPPPRPGPHHGGGQGAGNQLLPEPGEAPQSELRPAAAAGQHQVTGAGGAGQLRALDAGEVAAQRGEGGPRVRSPDPQQRVLAAGDQETLALVHAVDLLAVPAPHHRPPAPGPQRPRHHRHPPLLDVGEAGAGRVPAAVAAPAPHAGHEAAAGEAADHQAVPVPGEGGQLAPHLPHPRHPVLAQPQPGDQGGGRAPSEAGHVAVPPRGPGQVPAPCQLRDAVSAVQPRPAGPRPQLRAQEGDAPRAVPQHGPGPQLAARREPLAGPGQLTPGHGAQRVAPQRGHLALAVTHGRHLLAEHRAAEHLARQHLPADDLGQAGPGQSAGHRDPGQAAHDDAVPRGGQQTVAGQPGVAVHTLQLPGGGLVAEQRTLIIQDQDSVPQTLDYPGLAAATLHLHRPHAVLAADAGPGHAPVPRPGQHAVPLQRQAPHRGPAPRLHGLQLAAGAQVPGDQPPVLPRRHHEAAAAADEAAEDPRGVAVQPVQLRHPRQTRVLAAVHDAAAVVAGGDHGVPGPGHRHAEDDPVVAPQRVDYCPGVWPPHQHRPEHGPGQHKQPAPAPSLALAAVYVAAVEDAGATLRRPLLARHQLLGHTRHRDQLVVSCEQLQLLTPRHPAGDDPVLHHGLLHHGDQLRVQHPHHGHTLPSPHHHHLLLLAVHEFEAVHHGPPEHPGPGRPGPGVGVHQLQVLALAHQHPAAGQAAQGRHRHLAPRTLQHHHYQWSPSEPVLLHRYFIFMKPDKNDIKIIFICCVCRNFLHMELQSRV